MTLRYVTSRHVTLRYIKYKLVNILYNIYDNSRLILKVIHSNIFKDTYFKHT